MEHSAENDTEVWFMKQLSTMIEVSLLFFNFSNYQSCKIKGDLYSVVRKRKTNLTTFMSALWNQSTSTRKLGLPSFFSLPRENRLCFLWEVLRGTCTLSATFWNHKQDQTTSCKALNIVKEKLLLSLSQGVPQAGETWPAHLKWDKRV